MLRCIELAKNSLGMAAPNPSVGCVIVHNNRIIGEGYTSTYGGPHAEVNAIESVVNKSLLSTSTLYVSLEPCSHFGKTPPCADLIIKNNIAKVVIGIKDPNPKVSGNGIKKLREAGCEVVEGVLEDECRASNKRFFTHQQKKRPYIILKWAQSADGFIAPETAKRSSKAKPFWISNKHSRQLVHKWRSEEQAILVGTATAIKDNPKLNLRDWAGTSPIRIVLDRDLKIPTNFNLFDNSAETHVLTSVGNISGHNANVTYHNMDFSSNLPEQICQLLAQMNVISVIIEGGAMTLQSFIDSNLWDEARIFTGITLFDKGLCAPKIDGRPGKKSEIGSDTLQILYND